MREEAPPRRQFVVDTMLGKLAKWLRILGFNTVGDSLKTREQIDRLHRQGFLVITRNRKWCGLPGVLCLTENDPMDQLRRVAVEVPIHTEDIRLLHRCVLCNEPLQPLARELAFERVPDYVFETSATFHQCSVCHRVYWSGTHPGRMMERLRQVLGWSL